MSSTTKSVIQSIINKATVNQATIVSLVIVFLIAVRIPYMLTNHVQEDAYIHFQHMETLAETGEFGFNSGERVNGSTSTLYVLLYTPFFAALNGDAIPLILFTNIIILNLALYLIISFLMTKFDLRTRLFVLALVSLLPVTLITSFTGMETALLVTGYVMLLHDLGQTKRTWIGTLVIILLPWIRIDSIAFVGLYLLTLWFIDRKRTLLMSFTYGASFLLMLLSFTAYFGQVLPQTIIGKSVTYNVANSGITGRLDNGFEALSMVLLPIHSRFLTQFNVVWFAALFLSTLFVLIRGWNTPYRAIYVVIATHAVVVPAIYGLSGSTVFKWYIWPASILLLTAVMVLVTKTLTELFQKRSIHLGIAGIATTLVIALAGAQLVASLAAGAKEFDYRRSIGLWIRENSEPDSSIFLEPIGYIGYASDRYVHDSVGLVSPQTVEYRIDYGENWYYQYLKDYKPTFLVFRERNLDRLQESSEELRDLLDNNYTTAKQFSFEAAEITENPLIQRLLSIVDTYDYRVLRLEESIS